MSRGRSYVTRNRHERHMIIDGYNVLNAWPQLAVLVQEDLEYARDQLVHILVEYAKMEEYDMTIVFDALYTNDQEHEEIITKNCKVIYTKEKETADSYIERLTYEYSRHYGQEVYVVTSDGAEQNLILGAGAFRISASELLINIQRAKKNIYNEIADPHIHSLKRMEISGRLDSKTVAKLNCLRYRKD